MFESLTRDWKPSWRRVPEVERRFRERTGGRAGDRQGSPGPADPDYAARCANDGEDLILILLQAEAGLTQRPLTERAGKKRDGVKYNVAKLTVAGAIRRVGTTKAPRWEVIE